METDRKEVQGENLGGHDATEGLSVSCSARRKSWRRTTRGRRSLPALPNPYQTLCRSISTSLPQQERLEKLMEASMRLAIERTQNSMQATPNASLESFQKQVEHMQKEWCCVAKSLSSEPPCQQLPASTTSDPAVQKAMEKTQKAIQRLQAECDSWEALLNKHRRKAEELARNVEEGHGSSVTLDPSSLSQSSQYQLIQSKPDYRGLLSRQKPILHVMELVMDTQCNMVKELLSIQKQSQLFVKETSGRLASEAGLQDLSPDLIRNLVALPLSSATS
ncbi:kinetochore-associated protein DSN1 homolog isoform X2 [Myripristis murdjan]|nr:kinetochore-associated protein DSN1 homolog isoform X2 [Myripristis murdjan]